MEGWISTFYSGCFLPIFPCTVSFFFTAFLVAEVRLCHLPTPSVIHWCYGETILDCHCFSPLPFILVMTVSSCILEFIPSYLWETLKASVVFVSRLKQHSDTEAILYHSRWLTSQESSEENLMTFFAGLQETGTLIISSGLLHICRSPYPLGMGIYLPSWLTELPTSGWHCAFLYWTKCPNVLKTSNFQTLYTLLMFLPQLLQLRANDWTMRGHYEGKGLMAAGCKGNSTYSILPILLYT